MLLEYLAGVFGLVVEGNICAELFCKFDFCIVACRSDDFEASLFGELHDDAAYRASCACDEESLALFPLGVLAQAVECSLAWHTADAEED